MPALSIVPHRADTGPKFKSLEQVTNLVAEDLSAVNRHIEEQLTSDVALIRHMGTYLTAAGGKRLRPITLLLTARALNYRGTDHIALSAVIEFIHSATLLHDDVVDASELRRGKQTANERWGNAASVLVGDFIYSRAFEMMVTVNRMRVMEIMATTSNAIAEGEVMQLLHVRSSDIGEQTYLETIEQKTARLFESAASLGAVLAGTDSTVETALAQFGINLGIAFQIADDLLDYGSRTSRLGKNPGDDLAEGKCTLPLIHALRHGTSKEKKIIRRAIETGDREQFELIRQIIESTGSLAYTSRRARDHAEAAKAALTPVPASSFRDALRDLADFSVSRIY